MADEKQGLPFRVYDSVLGRMKKLVDTGSDVARESVGKASLGAGEANAATDGRGSATQDAAGAQDVPGTPAPTETDTGAAALATALNEEAQAAIAKHAGKDGEVTDGLAVKDQSGRVPPDEELGPEPFEPQVGP